ncbi:SPL family radical SAM protein [Halopiger xanaduensis]|uniref:Radical SAM domain protein n=1 Tax=Halopiger xanaduensis (strain DSM 18323 / JCM 14033 / SH-6) TaxID=797210 RepID=F8DEK2_HALXS|nr:radical SAM protein [Halopiger xanaduensis]AEH39289.1 Radical SAM domain protein [Halopiger xanaduensis SH-6]
MELTWEAGDSWFERTYAVENDDNQTVETLGSQPTLNELRKIERQYGDPTERLDLWQAGLLCADCSSEINDRFAANPAGEILCWDCAMDTDSTTQNGLRVNTDPTKSVMSESHLHTKSLCDHVINVATGCRHGCEFCYVPTTPAIDNRDGMLTDQADVNDPQIDWGSYLLYRDDLPERLHQVLENRDPSERKQTKRGRGIVMLSSGTDCYQDRRTAQITRGVVTELITHDIPVRILSRSPALVRDIDLFRVAGDRITVGSSIPSFEAPLVKAMEPNASPPIKRWEALDQLQQAGVPVFVSMSPTYPTMDEDDFHELLSYFRALGEIVVFHEPINPRGKNFQQCLEAASDSGYDEVAAELQQMRDDRQYWVEYALEQLNTVQQVATRFDGLHVHSWPDDELIRSTSGQLQSKLKAMQQAVSPESFGPIKPESQSSQSELLESHQSFQQLI